MDAVVPLKLGMAMNREQDWLKPYTKAIRPPVSIARQLSSSSASKKLEIYSQESLKRRHSTLRKK